MYVVSILESRPALSRFLSASLPEALRQEIDLRQALVFSSGRLPVDMVMKAIRAGIPLLATKAVPTDETVRLAREFGLTLVCQARPDSAVVYHDPLGCAAV